MCPTLTVVSFFNWYKVHFFVHLFNNLNYDGGSKHSNLRSASKTKRKKNKTRPEPRKHTKDPPLAPLFFGTMRLFSEFFFVSTKAPPSIFDISSASNYFFFRYVLCFCARSLSGKIGCRDPRGVTGHIQREERLKKRVRKSIRTDQNYHKQI